VKWAVGYCNDLSGCWVGIEGKDFAITIELSRLAPGRNWDVWFVTDNPYNNIQMGPFPSIGEAHETAQAMVEAYLVDCGRLKAAKAIGTKLPSDIHLT
jgi:hypothetical protein